MEQNPQEIVKLVKGQPDWHLTVNDNYDVIKQKIDDATGEVKREEFEALETEVADLGSNIVDMGATIADQNTTINGQTALIQGVDARIAVAEPKITTAQTTATNAATAAATADTKAVNAQTTANTANTTVNANIAGYAKVFSFVWGGEAVNPVTNVSQYVTMSNVGSGGGFTALVNFNQASAVSVTGFQLTISLMRRGNAIYVGTNHYATINIINHNAISSGLFSIKLTDKQYDYFAASGNFNSGYADLGLVRLAMSGAQLNVGLNFNLLGLYPKNVSMSVGTFAASAMLTPYFTITGFNGATPIFSPIVATPV